MAHAPTVRPAAMAPAAPACAPLAFTDTATTTSMEQERASANQANGAPCATGCVQGALVFRLAAATANAGRILDCVFAIRTQRTDSGKVSCATAVLPLMPETPPTAAALHVLWRTAKSATDEVFAPTDNALSVPFALAIPG